MAADRLVLSRTLPTSARFRTLSATASGCFVVGDTMLSDLCLDIVGWQ